MKFLKMQIILIVFLLVNMNVYALEICTIKDTIYADKNLANISIALPEQQSTPIDIKIHAPSFLFIGTDFPVVEGTDLLSFSVSTNQKGVYNFELVFPIRGIYTMEIINKNLNRSYFCNIEVLEHPTEIKNFYTLLILLFGVGFLSGIFIFITNIKKYDLYTLSENKNLQEV
ncbi:MAG: hypothetical protein KatS3mg129_3232 [Leptospiraceae bacterium]|nr:MAG: hypothetical protein KatS3mg129_3232 [Leptospiraceae bacterium]